MHTNFTLQRSIEALKLKSSVEKATLNDLHMNTIRVSHTSTVCVLSFTISDLFQWSVNADSKEGGGTSLYQVYNLQFSIPSYGL